MLYSGFLNSGGINFVTALIPAAFSSICTGFSLPETSYEGRTSKGMVIGKPSGSDKRKVLVLGGVHAREWANPDALLNFAYSLCKAYDDNTGLVFGGKTYSSSIVKVVVESIDLIVFPLVNPDGRQYSLSVDQWWRKNRYPNPGMTCQGVDINRNFDFLWSSGIGTSTDSCSQVYKGSAAASEPETRNVKYILDHYSNIRVMTDFHSYSELILYAWGDDDNQSTNSSMNFLNPSYDGLRGTLGSGYEEYLSADDEDWYVDTGTNIRDAIQQVRGRWYTLQESSALYPTTGTTADYSFSRHFANTALDKVYGFTIETGTTFFPSETEAGQIALEVGAAVMELCLAALCAAETTTTGTALAAKVKDLRMIREAAFSENGNGRHAYRLIRKNAPKVLALLEENEKLMSKWHALLEKFPESNRDHKKLQDQKLGSKLLEAADKFLDDLKESGRKDKELKRDIRKLKEMLSFFKDAPVTEALQKAEAKMEKKDAGK